MNQQELNSALIDLVKTLTMILKTVQPLIASAVDEEMEKRVKL